MSRAFVHVSFPILWGLAAAWMVTAFIFLKAKRFSLSGFLRNTWKGAAASALLTAVVAMTVAGSFKVLADETNQVNTARSLWLTGEARAPLQGWYGEDGTYEAYDSFIPKRPLLFPFLGHLLYRLFGDSERNLFRLNLAVLFALLLLMYTAARDLLGESAGFAAMLLALSNPVVALSARSAGFDLLSCFWFLLTLATLYGYMREPSSAGFAFLWMQLVVFCHIRYENFACCIVIVAGLAAARLLRREHLRRALPLLAATPVLLLPLLWQFALSAGKYESPEGTPLFGIGHFLANGRRLLATQLDFNFAFQSAFADPTVPVFLAVAAAWGFAAGRLKFPRRWQREFVLLAGACLALNLVIFLSLVHGDVGIVTSQRFFLTAFLAMGLAPLALLFFPESPVRAGAVLVYGAALVALYLPAAARQSAGLMRYPEMEFQREFLRQFDRESTLVVTAASDRPSALGYGAVTPATFDGSRGWFLRMRRNGIWSEIFVFQEVEAETRRIDSASRLMPGLELEGVRDVSLGDGRYLKVSRLR